MATFVCPMRSSLYVTAHALMNSKQVAETRVQYTAPNDNVKRSDPLKAFQRQVKPNFQTEIVAPIQYPRAIIQFQDVIEDLENPDKMQVKVQIGGKPVTVSYNISESGAASEMVAFGRGGSYPHLVTVVDKYKEKLGLEDADIAADIQNALQNKPLSLQDEAYEKFVARMTWLLFGTESGRNPVTLLTAPMMLDMIQKNPDMTFATFLDDKQFDANQPSKGGGLFPMSFKGAVPASRSIYEDNRYPGPKGTPEDIAEMEARETALLNAWAKQNKIKQQDIPKALGKLAEKTYGVPLQ